MHGPLVRAEVVWRRYPHVDAADGPAVGVQPVRALQSHSPLSDARSPPWSEACLCATSHGDSHRSLSGHTITVNNRSRHVDNALLVMTPAELEDRAAVAASNMA